MEFMLNKDLVGSSSEDLDFNPDTTILNMLRGRGLVGTKEGCASGDCGACTVMVGEADSEGVIEYRSVNACISLVGSLTNKHLVTVEGLAQGTMLHPAQQAMVEYHGSQCGFCTPGFVMSLATLTESQFNHNLAADQARDKVLDGISGNLCRCTGYRPIIDAGVDVLTQENSTSVSHDKSEAFLRQATKSFQIDDVSVAATNYYTPTSQIQLDSLVAQFGNEVIVAGCTDFGLEITQRWRTFDKIIDITTVNELLILEDSDDRIKIGAAVAYTDIEAHFETRSPSFVHLLHRLGSRQIRNRGTLGGNIGNASPIADTPPVLLAWDAELVIRSCGPVSYQGFTSASRTPASVTTSSEFEIPVAEFYLGYRKTVLQSNQYIAQINIPTAAVDRFHRFYKHSKRLEDDISSVMGAFSFDGNRQQLNHARVAYGGMAAIPLRVPVVEKLLVDSELTEELISQACKLLADTLAPMSDVRASAEFRSQMACEMLARALIEFGGGHMPRVDEITLSGNQEVTDV